MNFDWSKIHQIDWDEKLEQLRVAAYEYAFANPDRIDLDDVRARIKSPYHHHHRDDDHHHDQSTILNTDQSIVHNAKVPIQDWMLKRCLLGATKRMDVEAALNKFVEIFTLRARINIRSLSMRNTLPEEFFRLRAFLHDADCVDRDGNRVFIVRIQHYRRLPQLDELIKRGLAYIVEQHDLGLERGEFYNVAILVDCTGFPLSHVDLALVRFVVTLGIAYIGPLRRILVYGLPWALSFLLPLVDSWINIAVGKQINLLKAVDDRTIHDYIEPRFLPDFLNGERRFDRNSIPSTVLPLNKFFGLVDGIITRDNFEQIKTHYSKVLRELELY